MRRTSVFRIALGLGSALGTLALPGLAQQPWTEIRRRCDAPRFAGPHVGTDRFSIAVAIDDLDGDGDKDLAVACEGSNRVVTALNHGHGSFSRSSTRSTGNDPSSVAIDDLDGDGDRDLVVSNAGSDSVSVLSNLGEGEFASHGTYWAGPLPRAVAIDDLDGDGDEDLAVANYFDSDGSSGVTMLLNHGMGTFSARTTYGTGLEPFFVAPGDLDGDGDADLVVANYNSDNISVLFNDGDGSFTRHLTTRVGYGPSSVAIDDLDGDGDKDLAVAHLQSGTVSVLLNHGNGTFESDVVYWGGVSLSIVAGDLDGDGDKDLVVTSYTVHFGRAYVLMNEGDGTFPPPFDSFVTGGRAHSMALDDLDGDGDADLVVGSLYEGISVHLNEGSGTFAPRVTYGGGGVFSVAIEDLDGDGDKDLAAGGEYGGGWVLWNQGDGTLESGPSFYLGSGRTSVATGDLNGDGRPDLAFAGGELDRASVILNEGGAEFAPPVDYWTATDPFWAAVAIGDLDGDGGNDLVVADYGSDSVTVLLGRCP